jgi:ubiquinone biosynthesis protein
MSENNCFNKIGFLFQSIGILLTEYINYGFSKNYEKMIKNIAGRLAKINLFYVKIFQALSTNSNMLPLSLMDYLTQYTDHCPYTDEDIDTSFIKDLELVSKKNPQYDIKITNDKPINSGVISLIYEGIMNNKKVIIKVKRKNIEEKLLKSLDEIEFALGPISQLPHLKGLNIRELYNENRLIMLEQVDFFKEVTNLKNIYNFNKQISYVSIPVVYEEFTQQNNDIIVMDYLDGIKLYDIAEEDKEDYAFLLAKFGAKCILYDRLYHADLHQGNILFQKDENNNCKLGIIDFGIMGYITKEQQNHFYNFFLLVSNKEYDNCAKFIINHFVEPRSNIDLLPVKEYNNILKTFKNIFQNLYEKENGFLSAADLFEINNILYKYDLHLARYFCKIELSLSISDSICLKLDSKIPFAQNLKKVSDDLFPTDLLDY